ncbi:putative tRNA pseudouridine synthase Pus10 [Phytophthora boehmeriae]|uniref:tRNA pseudouridine(55) synthase n=1 Tax=Phytophthora boehmeriae TaxID=109152 RepID=A0A8T1X1R5_9STRA|nr:putative tRNA pseudouridine synthase Pus10 [Phytophthora boehmeriae]
MDLTQTLRDKSALSAAALLRARELGVCVRCCLRFADVDDPDVYACSEDKLVAAVEEFAQESDVQGFEALEVSGCICCVGVLNSSFHEHVLADVQRLAAEKHYDAKTFALSIKLPSVVLLREYALLQFLRSDVENFPRKVPFDMKDGLKSLIAPSISAMLHDAECANGSEFAVLVDIKHDESANEVRQIPAIKKQLEGTRKRSRGPPPVFDGFGAVSRALATLSAMPETVKSPPERLATTPQAVITFERDSVYMQGRYLKFQRGLSQTPWVLDGERLGESSVEECIGDIALPFFQGSSYKFHTAGREDVDVRMLGNGRPFILEILDAKKAYLDQAEYDQIQEAVNAANKGSVEIVDAKSSTKDYFAGLQAGADSKKKTYCCVVWSEGVLTPESIAKIDAIQDLTIQQQTPIRVLHRRTQMTRPKVIHAAKCEVLNKHYMLLRLATSAGTYVKEFVHGDRGRTNPNVASILGCDADIIQLDVESLVDAQ